MAHTYVNKSQNNDWTTGDITHTPGSAATVCILTIVVAAATDRTGGAPTIDGTTATQVGTYLNATEQSIEMWYVCKAFSGSQFTISIPNSNTRTCQLEVVTAYAGSGYSSTYNDYDEETQTGSVNGITLTPSVNAIGDFVYARCGSGENAVGSNSCTYGTGTYGSVQAESDHGTYTSLGRYKIATGTGAQSIPFAWSSDDGCAQAVVFKSTVAVNHYTLPAAAGSFSFTDAATPVKLTATRKMTAGTTSYSETGTAVTLTFVKTFTGQKRTLLNHIDSAQSEANGWDVEKANLLVSGVVRTSNTVVTITLSALSAYAITAQEVLTITVPGEILTGGVDIIATPTITITPSAAAYTLAAVAGSFSEVGTAAGLKATRGMTAGTTSYSETGTAVVLRKTSKVAAGTTTYSHSGTAVDLKATWKMAAGTATYSEVGTAVAMIRARTMVATAGAFSLVGTAVTLRKSHLPLTASAGAYSHTGTNVGLKAERKLTAVAGAFSEVGTAVSMVRARFLSSTAGAFSFEGTAVTLKKSHPPLVASAGSYSHSGTAVGLRATRGMTAGTAVYSEAGTAVDMVRARMITAGTAVYTFTGTSVTLTYVPVGVYYTLIAGVGTFSEVGTTAALKATRRLASGTDAYSLNGTSAGLMRKFYLVSSAGSFSEVGTTVALKATRRFTSGTGVFDLSGMNVVLTYVPAGGVYTLPAGAGIYLFSGKAVKFHYPSADETSGLLNIPNIPTRRVDKWLSRH